MKVLIVLLILITGIASAQTIVCPTDAPANVKLAAKEIRRYVYLRTGEMLSIADAGKGIALKIDPALGAQEYRLTADGITGGSDVGVLYGAYRYAELLGVRFYLHGDVIPDEQLKELPVIKEETGKPLFALRGINSWGYHPHGMDAWGTDDYQAVITQLAKMRMNFIGIHCYPYRNNPALPTAASGDLAGFSSSTSEPTIWHGLASSFDAEGRVNSSYPTLYYSSAHPKRYGGYGAKKTGDYSFGGSLLFDGDFWTPAVMTGHAPSPATMADCNDIFNRTAAQFREAFTLARQLGVKTCLGTEAPLSIPDPVQKQLEAQGKKPTGPEAVRAVYEGTFKRIMAAHPLDYYWLWTEENWTWHGNTPEQYKAVVADIQLADEARNNIKAPFQLATAGWVLGPGAGYRKGEIGSRYRHDRAAFDRDMPKHIAVSAINRAVGNTEVDPAFGRITGRDKWAIPWLEDDASLEGFQLWAGRMRRDAVDARGFGCTGLMGLHWRTDILAPNAAALAQAAWDQSWNKTAAWTVAGEVADYPNAAIAGTPDAPLYRSCRFNLGTIRLPAPAGKYKVTLKFCEPYFDAAGERICDVKIQGNTVLTNLDIFAKAGKFAALDYTFDNIAVADGTLTIELVARKSLPCISAIAVEGTGFTRKINCGGAAYKDWQADAPKPRSLPVDDFYADFAQANFGLPAAGRIFARMDGRFPLATAAGCPTGSINPDKTPWTKIAPRFAFVEEMEKLRPQIKGPGNLARFDYWLNTFRYHRALAMTRCAMGAKNPDGVMKCWTDAYTSLLATVSSPGGMSMVVTMENCELFSPAVAKFTGKPFPKEYQGRPRLIVPTVRSVVNKGESLNLKIIALPATQPTVHIRPTGKGDWQTIPATHIARAVYEAKLPAAHEDFEYYITAGENLVWPSTAPQLNQTVVVTQP
jgi:hypothetical protein